MSYLFLQPETMTYYEEYYVVPTLDLIGLIGGTLGMFVGFSFYGMFCDIVTLFIVISKKVFAKSKFFLSSATCNQ